MLVQKTLPIQMLLDTDTDTGALGSASFLPFIRFVVWYLSFFFLNNFRKIEGQLITDTR